MARVKCRHWSAPHLGRHGNKDLGRGGGGGEHNPAPGGQPSAASTARMGQALRFQACAQHCAEARLRSHPPPRPARQMADVSSAAQQATLRLFAHVLAQPTMHARVAHSVERKALNLVVVGSSPHGGCDGHWRASHAALGLHRLLQSVVMRMGEGADMGRRLALAA